MKKFAIIDVQNDMCFGFEVKDEDYEKAVELSKKGLGYWYMASHEDIKGTEDFTAEEIESFYWCGYAEPSEELLDKNGIEYTFLHADEDAEDYGFGDDVEAIYY